MSKAFGFASFVLLIFGVLQLITLNWILGVLGVVLSIVTAFIGYRLTGERRNPAIWRDKDLYDLLKHAALSGQARIGLHSLRDHKVLLDKLESIGIRKRPSENVRQFIREKVVRDRRAFDILRDDIIIQIIHNGKEWFWDGYGNKRTAQYFHKAEIIFDLKQSLYYIFSEVFEGLGTKNPKKENSTAHLVHSN